MSGEPTLQSRTPLVDAEYVGISWGDLGEMAVDDFVDGTRLLGRQQRQSRSQTLGQGGVAPHAREDEADCGQQALAIEASNELRTREGARSPAARRPRSSTTGTSIVPTTAVALVGQ